jgi:hypothetical protein
MVMLIALPLFSLSAYSQGRTVEIDIADKEYFPPARTLKIPPQFKEDGARLAVRAGDTIKICNKDRFVAEPFSPSKENKFEGFPGPNGLRPGSCFSYLVQNPGGNAIPFRLFDAIHPRSKLWLVVLPANAPDEGEEDTPRRPAISHLRGDTYPMSEGGEVIDPPRPPGTYVEESNKLSGTWKCDDGSTFVLTQSGVALTWEAKSTDGGKTWAHAFTGEIFGDDIRKL